MCNPRFIPIDFGGSDEPLGACHSDFERKPDPFEAAWAARFAAMPVSPPSRVIMAPLPPDPPRRKKKRRLPRKAKKEASFIRGHRNNDRRHRNMTAGSILSINHSDLSPEELRRLEERVREAFSRPQPVFILSSYPEPTISLIKRGRISGPRYKSNRK